MDNLGDRLQAAISQLGKGLLADSGSGVRDPGGLASAMKQAGKAHALNETTAPGSGLADLLASLGHAPANGPSADVLDVDAIIARYSDDT